MTILEEIIEAKKESLARAKKQIPVEKLGEQICERVIYYDFSSAITRKQDGPVRLISEIKHASPSKGIISQNFDPVLIGAAYLEADVDAISVLTEEEYFKGNLDYIDQIRQAGVTLPILRKDFIFDSYQIDESVASGADAILLIVASLDKVQLRDLSEEAVGKCLFPVVEVFNESELKTALSLKHGAVQINNRNLKDFTIDIENTEKLIKMVPPDFKRPVISASGFSSRQDVQRAEQAGVDAILVGESLMRQPDTASIISHVKTLRGE
jgi:indole-3-glycerol phosphate synthase